MKLLHFVRHITEYFFAAINAMIQTLHTVYTLNDVSDVWNIIVH